MSEEVNAESLKTFCISHVKDVDGIGAAALVMAATGAEILLTDYATLMEDLDRVPQDADALVICDVGSDDSNRKSFVSKLRKISATTRVTYIDHHFLAPAAKREIERAGVRLIHDEEECASMLTYETFKDSLPEGARNIALYGAVTDYMDGSPLARKLMERTDRQFVLAEATLLSHAVARKGDEGGFPESIVRELSAMKYPHEIDDVPTLALQQMREVVRLSSVAKKFGKRKGRLAYMDTTEHATGNVAKLLIGAFDVPVGVSMKQKQKGWYEVSIRGTSNCRVHLGRTIGKIAMELGGSGGGHERAAGCRIPVAGSAKMLDELSKRV